MSAPVYRAHWPAVIRNADDAVLYLAEIFTWVRELGENRGLWVEIFIKIAGGEPGQPWCMAFVVACLAIICGGITRLPIPRTMSTVEFLAHATAHGWLVDAPAHGDIGLLCHPDGTPHHAFFVDEIARDARTNAVTRVYTMEGNTNDNGSDEGDGAYQKWRDVVPSMKWIHWPRPVFA